MSGLNQKSHDRYHDAVSGFWSEKIGSVSGRSQESPVPGPGANPVGARYAMAGIVRASLRVMRVIIFV